MPTLVRSMASRSRNPPRVGSSHSVDDALANLDRAERLRDDGRYSEALEMYEHNIGVLIGHLKSTPKHSSIDRSVLADRVRVALSDAEAIKRFLDSGGERSRDNNERMPSKRPPSKISTAFSNILGIGKSHSHDEVSTATAQQLREKFDYAHAVAMRNFSPKNRNGDPDAPAAMQPAHSSSMRNLSPKKQSFGAHKSSSLRNISPNDQDDISEISAFTASTAHPKRQPSPERKKRSNLNYAASDPLVKVVKSELYVDKSQLTTRWEDVVGLVSAKRAMQEAAILPMVRPDLYTGLRAPPKGILLYGPPGTGKTMLVRAAAKESKCILFSCSASSLTSKWHGEGEKLLRTLFAVAIDAAPSMIFFDEIDALLESRKGDGSEHEASRRFKTEFMVQMDGVVSGNADGDVSRRVLVLGCTNCPWDIDDAVMRRMSRRIYVELPDRDARRFLLNKLLSKESGRHSLTEEQVESVVDRTEGYSCSDISAIAQEAAFGPLRDLGSVTEVENCSSEDVRWINIGDFDEALANTKRSVSDELMERYKAWEERQGVR